MSLTLEQYERIEELYRVILGRGSHSELAIVAARLNATMIVLMEETNKLSEKLDAN